jgi:O-antigen biosynthesis protein
VTNWSYYEDPRPDISALLPVQGLRVLDVGCGGGALGGVLKKNGAAFVAGVEATEDAAEAARSRLDQVVNADVMAAPLPFDEGEFDVLVFADVLEHLPDPDAALQRCLGHLRPDGMVVISVPNMRFWLVLLRLVIDRWAYADHGVRDRTHLRIFTRRTLLGFLTHHHLRIVEMRRNQRLLDDQSQIGRAGVVATRLTQLTLARMPVLRELLTYQYVVLARPASADQSREA